MEAERLAVFDFDGTLIRGDSIVRYLLSGIRARLVRPGEALRAAVAALKLHLGFISAERAKQQALSFTRRMSPKEREAFDRAFAASLLKRLRPAGAAALKQAWEEGLTVLLVSASTENYMRFVARGLPVNQLLCTKITPDGQVQTNCRGEEKLRRIDAWLAQENRSADWAASRAYGDSKGDFLLLNRVGHPYLVNPRAQTRRAAQGRYTLLRWQEPRK